MPDIEWRIGEETIRHTTPRPPRWRKWIVLAVVALGVGLGIAYLSIPEPPRPTPTPLFTVPPPPAKPAVPVKLYETIDREAQALADGDFKTFFSLQDRSDVRWFQSQIKLFQAWGRPLAESGSTTYSPRPLYTLIESGALSPNQSWVDVLQFRNGQNKLYFQYFRETRFYRQVNGQWLRTQPDLSFWRGKQQSFQTKHFEVSYPAEDNTFIQMVAQRFEAAYDQVCADLDCTGDLAPIQLVISPTVEYPQWSALDQHGTIVSPSPRISGVYVTADDETARRLDDPVTRAAYTTLVTLLVQTTSGSITWMSSDPTHGGEFFVSAIFYWEYNRVSSQPDVSRLLPPPELITNTQLVRLESLWNAQLTPSNPEQVASSVILFIEQKFGAASVGKFLKAIGPAHSFAQVIEASLGVDEAQFEQQWKDWLRQLSVQAGQ